MKYMYVTIKTVPFGKNGNLEFISVGQYAYSAPAEDPFTQAELATLLLKRSEVETDIIKAIKAGHRWKLKKSLSYQWDVRVHVTGFTVWKHDGGPRMPIMGEICKKSGSEWVPLAGVK